MSVELSFIIKKMISVLLMPWSVGVIVAVVALVFLYRNRVEKAKKYLIFSIVWSLFVSWSPFGNLMLVPLESRYSKLQEIPNVEYILLLGGDRRKRAWEALRLYHKIPNVKIITSGYSLHDSLSDAEKTADLLIEVGIPKDRIRMQESAKTTFEEAKEMKKLVGEKPFILITSAYHLPRAMMVFKKEGLHPIPAPTDFNHPNESGIFSTLQGKELQKTERAWHEYLGMLVYWMQGKI